MPFGVHSARRAEKQGIFTCSIEPVRLIGDEGEQNGQRLVVSCAGRSSNEPAVTNIERIDEFISCEVKEERIDVSDKIDSQDPQKDS